MREQPSGTVTLVFTDIEGSTRLLHELGESAYREALAEHRRLIRSSFEDFQGYEVDYEGDAFFYAFESARSAVSAVQDAMAALRDGPISVRVGLHTGEPTVDPPKYVGADVHLAARIMSAGHGAQVLLSRATRELVDQVVVDLGEHRLKDFDQPVWIFQLGDERFPPLKTISHTNLPRPASSMVGRERETAEVVSLIRDGTRLVTLTGPGGSGKTRLGIEAASELVPDFRNGLFWVGLAALRDASLVTQTIAQTVGAKGSLAEHVGERELLLLLDNLEQVVEAAPELALLVEQCPNLRLLVTSRELLRVRGEVEYAVPPLVEGEAVELFCRRSRLERDEPIAELCRRLDNLPLAVELAAARTSVLAPAQILDRLSQRLDLKGGRDADPRQQTLRTTIEWSYDLLSTEEQQLFRRLAVFAGGCTLEAAEAVAEADVDLLQSLVEKSLLRFTNGRYWLLETIREYAGERLRDSEEQHALLRRHEQFFLELAERADPELRVGPDESWLSTLLRERENLRAALASSVEDNEWTTTVSLTGALAYFWWLESDISEARHWHELALLRVEGDDESRAKILVGDARFAWMQRDYEHAMRSAEEALSLWSRLGNDDWHIRSLNEIANVVSERGDTVRARALYDEALERARHIGDDHWVAILTSNCGEAALRAGRHGEALRLYGEAIDVAKVLDYDIARLGALLGRAMTYLAVDRHDEGFVDLGEALRLAAALGVRDAMAECLEGVAVLAQAGGDDRRAAELMGTVESLRERTGSVARILPELEAQARRRARERLGEREFADALARGRSMEIDLALEYALRERGEADAQSLLSVESPPAT